MRYTSTMRILFYLAVCILVAAWSATAALSAPPVVVAVIDTGYTKPSKPYEGEEPVFCKMGHVDLTKIGHKAGNIPKDNHGHGTNIVHVIVNSLGKVKKGSYCIVVIKYWDKNLSSSRALLNSARAMEWANTLKVPVVNYSSSGSGRDDIESKIIKKMLDRGTKIVVAAGNEGSKLGYPAASDPRLIVVGNLNSDGTKNPMSNDGDAVDRWEIGTDVCGGNICLTGTSQATAVATGKILKQLINERDRR